MYYEVTTYILHNYTDERSIIQRVITHNEQENEIDEYKNAIKRRGFRYKCRVKDHLGFWEHVYAKVDESLSTKDYKTTYKVYITQVY